ncbi:class I SAM-dependent methyltransferase [candidate division KSB1 bacterium]|nr:class I SAM-dependent methyltransferase [candidate division KSB1 bacterium]
MNSQTLESQRGEIEFRKKLVQQQVEGKTTFQDEYDGSGIEAIMRQRMAKTVAAMTALQQQGVRISPYLEIGAERGQRSLAMENDLNAVGIAADLSFDMLKSCEYYRNVFQKEKLPLRVCCDANFLPFASGSMPFIFCYETLHHFPDPTPIVREIHRVLAPGGIFFFDEEPFERKLHLNLYKSKKIYSSEAQQAGKIRKTLDFFFAQKSCNETEHGIIENDEISLATWRDALSLFERKEIELATLRESIKAQWFPVKSYAKFSLAYLFGGSIRGVCLKSGAAKGEVGPSEQTFICPSCVKSQMEIRLAHHYAEFACPSCRQRFPIVESVILLLPQEKLKQLYPEIYSQLF